MSLALVLYQHDQAGHDVERRHQHDERQDQKHDVALDFQCIEKRGVTLAPIGHVDRPSRGLADELAEAIDAIGIVGIDLDGGVHDVAARD